MEGCLIIGTVAELYVFSFDWGNNAQHDREHRTPGCAEIPAGPVATKTAISYDFLLGLRRSFPRQPLTYDQISQRPYPRLPYV